MKVTIKNRTKFRGAPFTSIISSFCIICLCDAAREKYMLCGYVSTEAGCAAHTGRVESNRRTRVTIKKESCKREKQEEETTRECRKEWSLCVNEDGNDFDNEYVHH